MPIPSVYVCGTGLLETYFTTFPNSVVHKDLTPSQTPIALVVVSGDEVPTEVTAKQVARSCSASPNWKWEAVPHADRQFLVSDDAGDGSGDGGDDGMDTSERTA
jgi:hypothetical protein